MFTETCNRAHDGWNKHGDSKLPDYDTWGLERERTSDTLGSNLLKNRPKFVGYEFEHGRDNSKYNRHVISFDQFHTYLFCHIGKLWNQKGARCIRFMLGPPVDSFPSLSIQSPFEALLVK